MQNCSNGISDLEYDLDNVEKWEHLLIGEPFIRRKITKKILEEDDINDMYDEKHLDMPISWSMKISIPHDGKNVVFPLLQIKRTVCNIFNFCFLLITLIYIKIYSRILREIS